MLYSPTKFSILYTVYNKSLYIIANNKEINKKNSENICGGRTY